MLSKHTIIIIIIIVVLCTQKSIIFAPNSYHFSHSLCTHLLLGIFALKINMVYNIHCYISIYYDQNSCFLLSFKFFLQKPKGEKVVKSN